MNCFGMNTRGHHGSLSHFIEGGRCKISDCSVRQIARSDRVAWRLPKIREGSMFANGATAPTTLSSFSATEWAGSPRAAECRSAHARSSVPEGLWTVFSRDSLLLSPKRLDSLRILAAPILSTPKSIHAPSHPPIIGLTALAGSLVRTGYQVRAAAPGRSRKTVARLGCPKGPGLVVAFPP